MKKENAIVIWRIVFTYMIVAFHFSTTFPWLHEVGFSQGWYLAVEFFFLVSGYLIYAKYEDYLKKYKTAIGYTFHRYADIWPKYIISFIITFLAIMILGKNKLPAIPLLWDSKYEIVLLQGIGLDRGWDYINPTLWYLSVMIISGFLIFFLLRYLGRFFVGYLAPAVIILFMFLLYNNVGKLDVAVMQPGQYANYPLYRGISEMCLGMYGCIVSKKLKMESGSFVWKAVSIICMLAAIIIATLWGNSRMDFVVLILMLIGVATAFLPTEGIPKVVRGWSDITLEIYLLHEVFRTHIFPHFFSRDVDVAQKLLYMLLYMAAVTLAAFVLHKCFSIVGLLWKKEKR